MLFLLLGPPNLQIIQCPHGYNCDLRITTVDKVQKYSLNYIYFIIRTQPLRVKYFREQCKSEIYLPCEAICWQCFYSKMPSFKVHFLHLSQGKTFQIGTELMKQVGEVTVEAEGSKYSFEGYEVSTLHSYSSSYYVSLTSSLLLCSHIDLFLKFEHQPIWHSQLLSRMCVQGSVLCGRSKYIVIRFTKTSGENLLWHTVVPNTEMCLSLSVCMFNDTFCCFYASLRMTKSQK